MRFKRFENILNSPWHSGIFDPQIKSLPVSEPWKDTRTPTIDDIDIWEELHFEEGNLGVYAAWHPHTEFYIITYNLFMGMQKGIEKFFGPDAVDQVINRCKDLGVTLESKQIWVDPNQ
jgi:hypothetical protein